MEVGDVIAGARAFAAGGDRERSAELLRAAVEEEMPLRYAMPFPPEMHSTFYRRGLPTRTRRGQWHELVQHLTDLAYLRPQDFTRWHQFQEAGQQPDERMLLAVLTAVDAFVAEDRTTTFRLLPAPPDHGRDARLDWLERYLSPVVFRLSQLTSFDGELAPRPDYEVGEQSVYGRALAFRMRVYFYDYRVAARTARRKAYFDPSLLPQLVALASYLGEDYQALAAGGRLTNIPVALQEVLLRWDDLFAAYRQRHRIAAGGTGRFFLQYRLPVPVRDDDPSSKREARLRRRAARWARRNDDHVDTGVNHFGVRLLQLGLWRAGFYTGQLDGDIGPYTHRALTALIDQERAYGELHNRRLDRLLLPVGESAEDWVVDLRELARLLERYVPPSSEEAEREEEVIWERLREAGQEARVDEVFAERQREVRQFYGELSRHPQRRVYYGLRGLIRGAFRAIGRVIKWVAGVVEEFLGAVFDFVKSLAKRIQEGMGLFFTGFRFFAHYLLGRPFVTLGAAGRDGGSPVIMTRYRIDFDVVSFIDRKAATGDLQRHTALLERSSTGAAYFLDVTATCLRAVALLRPPLGWLRLAVIVARLIHGFLRRQVGEAAEKRTVA